MRLKICRLVVSFFVSFLLAFAFFPVSALAVVSEDSNSSNGQISQDNFDGINESVSEDIDYVHGDNSTKDEPVENVQDEENSVENELSDIGEEDSLDFSSVLLEDQEKSGLKQNLDSEHVEEIDFSSLANSFRFSNGTPLNKLVSTYAGKISWTNKGNGLYVGSDGTSVEGVKSFGIDVSEHDGSINWGKVKADGVDFAIIRVGYGNDGTVSNQDDKQFFNNIKGAQSVGIKIGVYIYSYGSSEAEGVSEAKHVLRLLDEAGLSPSDLDYPVYYDLEQEYKGKPAGINDKGENVNISNSTLLKMTKAFARTIEAEGYEVGIYANLNWWNNYLISSEYNQWDRWVAQYNDTCDYRGQYSIWQRTSSGSIDGINGNVDINFDFTSRFSEGLVETSDGLKYQLTDGSYLKNSWKEIGGKKYYFGDDEYAVRYTQVIDGKTYYFTSNYFMATGRIEWSSNGKSSLFGEDGVMIESGWADFNGKKYYVGDDGYLVRYSQVIDGNTYYFTGNYFMATGWVVWASDGTRSYFGSDGVALTEWQTIDGKTYYFDPNNYCHSLRYTQVIDGKTYYFTGDCFMATGWVVWASDGTRSYFDKDGVALAEWQTIDGKTYYFDPNNYCHSLRYTQVIDGKTYYFTGDCFMATGRVEWSDSGKSTLFGEDGAMIESGWAEFNGKKYYADENGYLLRYTQVINDKTYYFTGTYFMATGWVNWASDGTWSYFGSDGVALSGWQTIDGKKYYFLPDKNFHSAKWTTIIDGDTYYFYSDGSMHTGWLQWASDKKWSYFGSDGVMYTGKHTIAGVTYDFGSDGRTSLSLNRTQLLNRLNSASSSSSLTYFGKPYNFNSSAGKKLKSAVNAIRKNYSVGFVMIDLKTGFGVASSPAKTFYSASTIKGPYVAAINKYKSGSVTSSVKNHMKPTINVSSNEDYAWLRNKFGSSPMKSYMSYAGVSGKFSSSTNYVDFTARDLAKLWVANYDYFFVNTNKNSSYCKNLFKSVNNSVIRNALKSKYTTYSKAGWIGDGGKYYVQNDSGIVMSDEGPYVITILSKAYNQKSKLQTLVKALDAVHDDIV